MGTIRDRNDMYLTEEEDIKKNTKKSYTKKDLNDPDNHVGYHTPRARHPGM